MRRSDVARGQDRLQEIQSVLTKLRRDNDKGWCSFVISNAQEAHLETPARQRLRFLRENLAMRRQTLSQAKLLPLPSVDQLVVRESQQIAALSDTLARARTGLVSELVEVFNIVEVGGRPPIGGKAGTRGEWTIGDLVLPVPGDIRRQFFQFSYINAGRPHITLTGYPPDHINAVITHTIHFLGLLTFYLGVKLPFDITWTGGKLGVGQPWIRSIKGMESGSWAKYVAQSSVSVQFIYALFRWTSKQCLHVSTSAPSATVKTVASPTFSQSMSASDSVIESNVLESPQSSLLQPMPCSFTMSVI